MTKEEFRKKLKTRVLMIRIFILLFILINAAVRIYDRTVGITIGGPNIDFLTGFIVGLSLVFVVAAAYLISKYTKALNNEDVLEEIYLQDIDERTNFIRQKSGADVLCPMAFCMIGASLIAGYFSLTVCITLIAVETVQMLVCTILKIYYSKKY